MKNLLAAGAMSLALLWAGPLPAQEQDFATMPMEELIETAPEQHPAALYILAARLLGEGRGQEAANWMYAGQLRYRFLLAVAGEEAMRGDGPLFGALSEQVGRPVNEYIAGDVDEWIAAIDWALDWDEANDNSVTSKTDHAEELAEIRTGLVELRDSIDERREEIVRLREENGLENR